MASECSDSPVKSTSEDEDFHQTLSHVGGTGNMYLVGDVCEVDSKRKCNVLQEFIADIFRSDDSHGDINLSLTDTRNGDIKCDLPRTDCVSNIIMPSAEASDRRAICSTSEGQSSSESGDPGDESARVKTKVVQTSGNISAKGRTITCAIIIFIFRHVYVHNKGNRVCLEEILKDVKTRTKRNGVRPALLGLIYSDVESAETRDSVMFLEQALRSVFTKHPHDSIWAGHFISKAPDGMQTIKRHICTTVHFSQSPDNMLDKQGCFSLPLRRWFRGEHRSNTNSNSLVQKGDSEHAEEGIPLQMRPMTH